MSKTVRILIKRTQTAMIVLGSRQVFVFQLALLNHLQRTVTGQRMRGYEGGDEEELVVEEKTERHLFDSRALQSAKLEPLPNNAVDFRVWKNSLILMLGRLDMSGTDYFSSWTAQLRNVLTLHVLSQGWTDGLPQSSSKA